MLAAARAETGLAIVTEVMAPEHVPMVAEYADVLQIGARNMQNYQLLQAVGDSGKPALLKRGMSATIDEFLLAAEYILDRGNPERHALRARHPHLRGAHPVHPAAGDGPLPPRQEPPAGGGRPLARHGQGAAGRPRCAKAAVAAGADALIIEVHDDPEHAVSDGAQTITPAAFGQLMDQCRRIAEAVDRTI